MNQNKKGSLTAEAALIMPPMLAVFVFFLFWLQILTAEIHIENAAAAALEKSASCGYFLKYAEKWQSEALGLWELGNVFPKAEELVRSAAGSVWFADEVRGQLAGDSVVQSTVQGGISGISFRGSNPYAEDEMTVLHIRYQMVFPMFERLLPPIVFEKQWMMQSFSGQGEIEADFGTDTETTVEEEDTEEDYVYVARTGSVYHLSSTCSYIHVDVSACTGKNLEILRNESGAKYYACEACGGVGLKPDAGYWVTRTGTRYHTKKNCSKIKRDVVRILRSQASDYRPCSRCAAKQIK